LSLCLLNSCGNTGSTSDELSKHYLDPERRVSFDYPADWTPTPAALPEVIVLLSSQPITDPCAGASPPPGCREKPFLKELKEGSLIVQWAATNVPVSVYQNAKDDNETVDGHQFRAESTAVDQVCSAESGNDAEVVYIALRSQPVASKEQVFLVNACIRSADPKEQVNEIFEMVHSSRIPGV
jgi:hypothetical protein